MKINKVIKITILFFCCIIVTSIIFVGYICITKLFLSLMNITIIEPIQTLILIFLGLHTAEISRNLYDKVIKILKIR